MNQEIPNRVCSHLISVKRLLVLIVLCYLGTDAVWARLLEVYAHKSVVTTPGGWIGAIDWVDDDGGYSSRIFLGPVECVLPGEASTLIWVLPGLVALSIIICTIVLVWWKQAPRWLRAICIGGLASYYGLAWALFAEAYFGDLHLNYLVVLSGAPLSLVNSEPLWLNDVTRLLPIGSAEIGWFTWSVIGVLFAIRGLRWARRSLIAILLISYASGIAAASWSCFETVTQKNTDWRWFFSNISIWWVSIWVFLYVLGHAYIWWHITSSRQSPVAEKCSSLIETRTIE